MTAIFNTRGMSNLIIRLFWKPQLSCSRFCTCEVFFASFSFESRKWILRLQQTSTPMTSHVNPNYLLWRHEYSDYSYPWKTSSGFYPIFSLWIFQSKLLWRHYISHCSYLLPFQNMSKVTLSFSKPKWDWKQSLPSFVPLSISHFACANQSRWLTNRIATPTSEKWRHYKKILFLQKYGIESKISLVPRKQN